MASKKPTPLADIGRGLSRETQYVIAACTAARETFGPVTPENRDAVGRFVAAEVRRLRDEARGQPALADAPPEGKE